jgi:Dynamin family
MDERLRETANGDLEGGDGVLPGLARTLDYALRALEPSIGRDSGLVDRLGSLKKRFNHSRLQLAVLGQFKRGKSTFINALLGAPLLPVDVVPLTAVPIFISWQKFPCVRIRFKDGHAPEKLLAREPNAIHDFLFRFVAEEANPQNRMGVSRAELFVPAALLASGTVIIDTPGIGSTFRHNTETALNTLAECDAALFIISADPPITETELEFLRQVKAKAAQIFYVLNKIDYLQPSEQESVARFLRDVLVQNGLLTPEGKIFSVSARMGLEAKQRCDREAFKFSGMADVEALLLHQLASEKAHLLEVAMAVRVVEGLSQGISELSLRSQVLKLPLDELASKASAFAERLRSIEERHRIMRDLLAAEQRNLREEIERSIASLRTEAEAELAELLSNEQGEERLEAAPAAIERIFNAARTKMVDEVSNRTKAVIAQYQKRIDGDIEEVRRTAAEIFRTPFSDFADATAFTLDHEPYWVTQRIATRLLPDAGQWLVYLLPADFRAARKRARTRRQLKELVIRNAENLRWSLLRGTDEAFRAATANLQARLDDALNGTHRVIEETLARRRNASYAIEPQLDHLARAEELLSVLRRQIGDRGEVLAGRLDVPAGANTITSR